MGHVEVVNAKDYSLTPEEGVSFPPVDYERTISHEHSWGAIARRLWEEKLMEVAEHASDSVLIRTGIGGAPGRNGDVVVRRFGDGSVVAPYYDLQRAYGRVPRIAFLTASLMGAEDLLNLSGLARTYKEQGVEKVIFVLTSLAHERQDHMFIGADGQIMPQITTLKDAMQILSLHGDAALLTKPHSLRSVELGLRYGLPVLPLDPFKFMMRGLESYRQHIGFVLGPDKGRKDDGRTAASWLRLPMGSATKTRDREHDGKPTVYIPQDVLEYIREHKCDVLVDDDEIREGGTMGAIAHALDGYAEGMIVVAFKPIFAGNGGLTAVDHLNHPLIKRVIVTDAVHPLTDVSPIVDKLTVLPLEPQAEHTVAYLQNNLVDPNNPNWLQDAEEIGSLLRLDLRVEEIN